MLEMLQPPRFPSSGLVLPSLTLIVLYREYYQSLTPSHPSFKRLHTSIRLFSLLALSKSPSRIPPATSAHNFLLSHSPCSSIGLTVTSSLGGVTSWNVNPVDVLEVVCHVPSTTSGFRKREGGLRVALKECDLPEK